jgi:anthranilate phosphoribosyltransferase
MADRDDDAQILHELIQVVDPRCHVLERRRPAAASAEPPVLQIPRGPAGTREVLAQGVHQRAVVRVAPEAAVDHHHHRGVTHAKQFTELARMVAVAVDSAGDTLIESMSAPTIQPALARVLDGASLERGEAREVMGEIMRGEATPAQMGAFLAALRAKGETADEIAGCAEAMREHVVAVRPRRDDLVDTAGTGGDGARTLNISTAAGLVAAAAGAGVAKHGNRAVSSACGSADVLEALGFKLELPPVRIARSIDELGFGFMFAPAHHPAMRHAAPVRRELATRTVFNVLGPLTNPAGARAQVIGVFSPDLVRTIADVVVQLGARRAFVVHGFAGIDELSPAGPNLVCEVVNDDVRERTVDPAELGLTRCEPGDLRGGTPEENAQAIREVLRGADGGRRDAVLLNAAGAIAAAGHAADLREGLELARTAVDSGAALDRLEALAHFSHEGDGAL